MSEQERRLATASEGLGLFEQRRWAEEEAQRIIMYRDELTLECLLAELAEFREGDSGRRSVLRDRFIWGCAFGGLVASILLLAARLLWWPGA